MNDVWHRLQQACERLRPGVARGGLNPPATEAQIHAVEQLVGYRFPDELREAYLHFNGSSARGTGDADQGRCPPLLLPYFDWASLDDMVGQWVIDRSIERDSPPWDPDELEDPWTLPYRPCSFHPGRLAIGVSDTMGHLLVDLDPAPHGRVGQLLTGDPSNPDIRLVAPGLAAWFERLLDALDAGLLHWDENGQWLDAHGAWVHNIVQVAGPWPPLVPGGAACRLAPAAAALPPAPARPPAFDAFCAEARGWMPQLPPAGHSLPVGAPSAQIAHAEAAIGRRLPQEAAACWSVSNGQPLHPTRWYGLDEAVLQHRGWRAWAVLHAPVPEGLGADDGSVRPGPWRPGWLPVSQRGAELICLDLDPGPSGNRGQLIAVAPPSRSTVPGCRPAAPRRLADGLAPWLRQQATGAASPEGFRQTPAWAAWQALAAASATPPAEAAPAAAWSPLGWEPDRTLDAPQPLLPRRWRVFKTLRHEHPSAKVSHLGASHEPAGPATTQLGRWADGRAPGRGLVVAPIGAGTTSVLRQAFAKLRAAWLKDPAQPLPVLLDAAGHGGTTSLQALLQAEAAHRGASAEGMLAALAEGRCALIVDHVEALLPAWPGVWAGCDALHPPSARVLFACASEAFASLGELRAAFDTFVAWDDTRTPSGWLAVHAEDANPDDLAAERCRLLGFTVDEARFRVPQVMGDLAGRLGFVQQAAPWLCEPPMGDASPMAMQGWWRWLASRQALVAGSEFIALVHDALLARWQPTAPLPGGRPAALRPWLCAALGLRSPDGEPEYSNIDQVLPLGQAMRASSRRR